MRRLNTEQPNAEGAKDSQRTQKDCQIFENDFSREIIGAAVEVQRVLGPGLLESAYKGRALGVAYRADFIVEGSVIVELKAMDAVSELHRAQLLSYLRVSGLKLGLLINFHSFPVVKGIHRVVNKL